MILNISALQVRYGWQGLTSLRYVFVDYAIPVFIMLIGCNILIFCFNAQWARKLHVASFFFQCYFILFDSVQDFYGWGMGLIALLLMYKYGFFARRVVQKSVLLYLSFILCCVCSVLANQQPLYITINVLIFSIFTLSFSALIFKDEIAETLKNRQRIAELQNKIFMLQSSLEEQQEVASIREQELRKQLSSQDQCISAQTAHPDKKNILSDLEKLTREQAQLNSQQNQLRNLETDIRTNIFSMPELKECTDQELELIFLFYIHRGNLTNKEMASLMNTNCDAIKYRMRTIYRKIDGVENRTGLLAYIDDNI